ncbi:MAG TPA: HD domain-containing protein [Eubacteriaceae bacterium]|nr:HD domain-containing protein [Eubacteriaceae bacterium]
METMKRINQILTDSEYQRYLKRIEAGEKERIFCKHTLEHFIAVCRIGWILALEEQLSVTKEEVYAAGLLHDIGRWQEIESGVDHAKASGELARLFLERHGFGSTEIDRISEAIEAHRQQKSKTHLGQLLYRADKLSRPCFACDAIDGCKRFQNGEVPYLRV